MVAEYYVAREGVEEREVTEVKAQRDEGVGEEREGCRVGERARPTGGADTFLIKTVSRRN